MIVGGLVVAACRGERPGAGALRIPGEDGPRITVEVLNASGRPGLAKVATRVLRGAGIDVVAFGNAGEALGTLDSTRIVVRRGTAAALGPVRAALQCGRVTVELDRTKLLDASVFLGRDFTPWLEFHP